MENFVSLTAPKDTAFYWNLLKDTSAEIKIHLITLLSQSLSIDSEKSQAKSEMIRTKAFLDEFYGAWNGNESAEEIMATIRNNNSIRKPPAFD